MTSWREHAEAFDEFRSAAARYDEIRPGLAESFMDAVDRAIETILDSAVGWGFYRGQRRVPQVYRRRVPGFPYEIVFLRGDGEVIVIAYAHERRRPGYWEHRLGEGA